MAAELVRVNQAGGVTWHSAVSHAAAVLTPWGAGATVAAQLAACVSEISTFKLERERLARTHAVLSQALTFRQQVIVKQFEEQKRASMYVSLNQGALIAGWHIAIEGTRDMSTPMAQRKLMADIVKMTAHILAADSVARGNQLIKFITAINLDSAERDVAIWRQLPR